MNSENYWSSEAEQYDHSSVEPEGLISFDGTCPRCGSAEIEPTSILTLPDQERHPRYQCMACELIFRIEATSE